MENSRKLIARVLRTSGLRVVMIGKHADKLRLARLAASRPHSLAGVCRAPRMRLLWSSKRQAHLRVSQWRSKSPPRAATLVLKSTFHGAADIETWQDRREGVNRRRLALRPFRLRSLCCAREASIRAC